LALFRGGVQYADGGSCTGGIIGLDGVTGGMESLTNPVNVSSDVVVLHGVDEVANHFFNIIFVSYVSDPGLDSGTESEFEFESPG